MGHDGIYSIVHKHVGVLRAETADKYRINVSMLAYRQKCGIWSNDLYELGLTGSKDSAKLREKVGNALHIGFGNAKTMLRRLNCLGITKEELEKVIHS